MVQASHSWNGYGNYRIKVKAKNTLGYESKWSGSHWLLILETQIHKLEDPVSHPPIPQG